MIKKKRPQNQSEKILTKDYALVLSKIKNQVQGAQVKAILSINKELIKLYWSIGEIIVNKQEKDGWGSNTIEKLAEDLQKEFPGIKGFSRTNVFRMRAFYLAYSKVSEPPRQFELPIFNIGWWHNVIILTKLKNTQERLWYIQKSIQEGCSGNTLESYIKSDLYKREGKAITNFSYTMPKFDSTLAQQSFKDPYIFDFLTLQEDYLEYDLEQGLIDNVQKLLLEMGRGFALVGRQFHLQVGDENYYLDLLFYHTKLKCYVVVELKNCPFMPEHAGKINFYLSAVDDLVKSPDDKPTIGLLLCKTKNNFTAEYALRNINSPIGVAEYQTELINKLPKDLKSSLPTIEEIEAELEKNEILEEQSIKNINKN